MRLLALGLAVFGSACAADPRPIPADDVSGQKPRSSGADVVAQGEASGLERPEPHPAVAVGSRLVAYVGPRFVTGEAFIPEARAVIADETGRVRALLKSVPPPGAYETVQLPGVLAVAGLHDAHLHIEGIGAAREHVDLINARRPAELGERVAAFVKQHPTASFVQGRGWDQSRFPNQAFPSWRDLEGAAAVPVLLKRVDGHAAVANRQLLTLAGISRDTKDPPGGRLLRDASGEPTGVFVDNAIDLLTARLPTPADADRQRWLLEGMAACADAGDVAVADMGMSVASYRVLARLDDEGRLPVRVFVYLDGTEDAAYDLLGTRPDSQRLYLMGVKLYVDGALGSRGAALIEGYADEPGKRGLLLTEPEMLARRIERVHKKGFQAALHAIGDRGNQIVLDVLAQHHDPAIQDRVEHAQVVAARDFRRFAELGLTASMQPTHATSDMRWAADRLGQRRLEGAYAWRTFQHHGVVLAFGSDAPVEDERPSWGIYAAVTRTDHDGRPQNGFLPEQKLGQTAVLRAFAEGAARAVNQERQMGALTPGMYFDVTLFDTDAAAATEAGDASAWLRTRTVGTVVGATVRRSRSFEGTKAALEKD